MIRIKGYKPSKRCATYIKKMIGRRFWKVDERISTIEQIATKLDVSQVTVRNVIKQFEHNGVLENWGSLGFYLKSSTLGPKKVSKNTYYLAALRTNLNAFDMLSAGGFKIKNWIIKYQKGTQEVIGLNEVTGLTVNTNLIELRHAAASLISYESILRISDVALFEAEKKKFDRQREILPVAKLVLRYKKDLGIND